MLYGYPLAATQNNWLHECLCEALRTIHGRVDTRKRYPNWPGILPAAYRSTLSSRTGLKDRFKAYANALSKLSKPERDRVITALDDENRIAELLSGVCDCATIDELPEPVRQPAAELFGFAFGLLTDLGIRDVHYAAIYSATPNHVCPFCGTEYFDAPGAPREALDHYLVRILYPFAATNLRNLVPMGPKCNSSYKQTSDLLRSANGTRRTAFDPYIHTGVSLSLDKSEPFAGATENTPKWIIEFSGNSPEVETWDAVFHIRERYRRDHLDRDFKGWLGFFAKWARKNGVQVDSDEAVIAALMQIEEFYTECGLQDRAFLKAAVFRMLRLHCEAGDRRLLAEIRNLIRPPSPAQASVVPGASIAEPSI